MAHLGVATVLREFLRSSDEAELAATAKEFNHFEPQPPQSRYAYLAWMDEQCQAKVESSMQAELIEFDAFGERDDEGDIIMAWRVNDDTCVRMHVPSGAVAGDFF